MWLVVPTTVKLPALMSQSLVVAKASGYSGVSSDAARMLELAGVGKWTQPVVEDAPTHRDGWRTPVEFIGEAVGCLIMGLAVHPIVVRRVVSVQSGGSSAAALPGNASGWRGNRRTPSAVIPQFGAAGGNVGAGGGGGSDGGVRGGGGAEGGVGGGDGGNGGGGMTRHRHRDMGEHPAKGGASGG